MHVIVLGAGVIGVTTAHALAVAGHEVTLIERESGGALGTSYANAGQISPALSAPWAAPGLVKKAVRWMLGPHSPLVIGKLPDPVMIGWLWRMYLSATPARYAASKKAMVRLGELSRDRLDELRTAEALDYDGRQRGTRVAFRSTAEVDAYDKDLKALAELGVPARRLTRDEFAQLEPNVDVDRAGVVGGVLLPGDQTGDCRLFTLGLLQRAADRGVTVRLGTSVRGLLTAGGRVVAVDTSDGEIAGDAVVATLGVGTKHLLAPHGLDLPIYPMKGYSLTIAADSETFGPHSTVYDEKHKVGLTGLGGRIRIGGTAELAGYDLSRKEKRFGTLFHVARTLFPQIPEAALTGSERWSGLRPMTPDGPPIIGKAVFDNLIVNAGHGTLGWTMACGSAALVADIVEDRPPAIDLAPFSPLRYR